MSIETTPNKLFNKTILLIFPAIMVHMFLRFMGYSFVLLGLFPRVGLFACAIVSLNYCKKSTVQSALLIFIFYNILSILYLNSPIGFEGYSYDLLNFVLPMSAFYIGANTKYHPDLFYKSFLYSVLFCCGIGLLLFFFSTGWYVQRISEQTINSVGSDMASIEDVHKYTRFSSFMFDPYAIQYLGIPSLSILFYRMSQRTHNTKKEWVVNIVMLFILSFSILLCQQRMSWGYMGVLFAFYLIVGIRHKEKQLKYVITAFLIIVVLCSIYLLSGSDVGDVLLQRSESMSFNKALSGRTNQYALIWNSWDNYILGHGLGAGGAIALMAGLPAASDAGYMKILYENGLLGMTIFLFLIVIPTLFKGLLNWRYYLVEIHIVVFFLIAMIGSNSLCISFYYGIIFWFAVGRIWNNKQLIK